jgi:predicted acylesterase/phospholipase RssA
MATTEKPGEKIFYVGLCMAGAVSAGAYTAGVMDYLIEALTEWEKRRGQPGVPTHRVQIPVMGGASAGGMTSVMAACALNNPLTPLNKPSENLLAEHPENKLYHSWVDLTGVDMFSQMLDTSDIKPGEVESALNSDFINPIAKRVVDANPELWQPLPPFIKPGLKVFTTLTNLQGFDYYIPFSAATPTGKSKYVMSIHSDYACFELT